ncbi:MAG: chalcone isomerase family protein, partial [Spirochaetia bacterium]|nr:chalcone isomerase family protein [Spirochaetia bacterium]
KDYFQKALGKDFGGQEIGFKKYMEAYDRPLVKGDVVEVSFAKSRGISFVLSGKTNAVIPGLGFKKALHTAWFGDKSPDPSFRKDLLGF